MNISYGGNLSFIASTQPSYHIVARDFSETDLDYKPDKSNAYSEIGPEVTLRPLATSCAKDNKGHSLLQTRFTELPNSGRIRESNKSGMDWVAEVNTLHVCIIVQDETV